MTLIRKFFVILSREIIYLYVFSIYIFPCAIRWIFYRCLEIKESNLIIRGGSRKKIAKKITPSVPTNKNVYTRASIK
jgi:hypothetical protein